MAKKEKGINRINLYKKYKKGYRSVLVEDDFGKVIEYQLFYSIECAKYFQRTNKKLAHHLRCMSLPKAAMRYPDVFGWCS